MVQLRTLAPKFGTDWYEGAHFCKIARTAVSSGVFDVEARTAVSSDVFDVEARTAISSDVFDGLQKNTPMARVHWRENTPLPEKHAQHATQPTICFINKILRYAKPPSFPF